MGDLVHLPGMEDADVAMVRFTGPPLEYIDSVARRRKLKNTRGVVEAALTLMRLADEMGPDEYLAVMTTVNGRPSFQRVILPWEKP